MSVQSPANDHQACAVRPLHGGGGMHDAPGGAGMRASLRHVQGRSILACPPGQVQLLVPVRGDFAVDTGKDWQICTRGLLLIQSGRDVAIAAQDALCLMIEYRSERVNAAASAARGDGRRLARMATLVEDIGPLHAVTQHVLAQLSDDVSDVTIDLASPLVSALLTRADADALLHPVRAISEAMRIIRQDHSRPVEIEQLATMAGVTPQTLRKGFRSCVGMTVKEYAAAVRLDWARDRLASARESSPVSVLARLAGFTDATNFSRSYARRFGETPSKTRARAVRMAA